MFDTNFEDRAYHAEEQGRPTTYWGVPFELCPRPTCGAWLDPSWSFCPDCGARQNCPVCAWDAATCAREGICPESPTQKSRSRIRTPEQACLEAEDFWMAIGWVDDPDTYSGLWGLWADGPSHLGRFGHKLWDVLFLHEREDTPKVTPMYVWEDYQEETPFYDHEEAPF